MIKTIFNNKDKETIIKEINKKVSQIKTVVLVVIAMAAFLAYNYISKQAYIEAICAFLFVILCLGLGCYNNLKKLDEDFEGILYEDCHPELFLQLMDNLPKGIFANENRKLAWKSQIGLVLDEYFEDGYKSVMAWQPANDNELVERTAFLSEYEFKKENFDKYMQVSDEFLSLGKFKYRNRKKFHKYYVTLINVRRLMQAGNYYDASTEALSKACLLRILDIEYMEMISADCLIQIGEQGLAEVSYENVAELATETSFGKLAAEKAATLKSEDTSEEE